MERTFATYEHSTIGFPKIILKWTEENGRFSRPYVVIKDIIQQGFWTWHNTNPEPFIDFELKRFDNYIFERYGEDATVQG